MQKTKRVLSVLLAILMLVTAAMVGNLGITASALSPRTTAPASGSVYWYNQSYNPFAANYVGQCTWYAWGRAYEILGSRPNLSTGNAGQWYSDNISRGAYSYGSTPRVGAIMVSQGPSGPGHVSVVEVLYSNGTMLISEYNWRISRGFSTETISQFSAGSKRENQTVLGYIYLGNFSAGDEHTHSYTLYYESAHPHKYFMKCSCGDWYYTGQNAAVMAPGYEAVHPHYCFETCSICGNNFLTGETTTMPGCSECQKPKNAKLSIDRTTLHQDQTIKFESSATNVESYTISIDLNGTRIVNQKVPHVFYYKCEEAGTYTAYVSACNSYGNTDSPKVTFTVTPHAYDEGTVTKAATCTEDGVKTYTCTVCGETRSEPVPAGHIDEDGNGYCDRCDAQVAFCPWCGGVHVGFFQGIIGWFHGIFAKIFGAKY